MPSEISATDRDLMIRTVMGEVDPGDPDAGRAAVAHVILNRLSKGGYGDSASQVVLSRNQFEPWSTRRRELMGYPQDSSDYRHTAEIVDSVLSGAIPDLTEGATHFVAPKIMAGRGGMPPWTRGHKPSAVIGGHNFYNDVVGGSGPSDPFAAAGFTPPGAAAPQGPAAAQGAPESDDPFVAAGFTPPTTKPAPAAPAATPAPPAPSGSPEVPLSTGTGWAAKPAAAAAPAEPTSLADRIQALRSYDPIYQLGGHIATRTGESYAGAKSLAGQGLADIKANLPAKGVGEIGLGVLGMAGSPVTGTIQGAVADPVTQLTGSPEIGERAGLLASIAVPVPPAAKVAEKLSPTMKGTDALVQAIGAENVPEALARLRSNPRLRLMDVSDPVRTMAQGIAANPAEPAAMRTMTGAVASSRETLPAWTNTAYTEAMGPAPDVVQMVKGLEDRAREVGRKEIQPVLDKAKPVDVSPVIAAIDAEVRPGIQDLAKSGLPLSARQQELQRLRNQLVNADTGEMLTDANRLHQIQSETGTKAFLFQKSPDGQTQYIGKGLRNANETLISAIDDAAGGAYRPARAKFKDAEDIHRAFDAGFDTLKNRQGLTGLQDRPESLKAWMDQATPEEVVARRLGTRSDIDQKIRGVRNQALAGQNITQIEYNQEKLRTLFGQDEANRLTRVMKDAQDEARTNAKLVEGSKTAETLMAKQALETPPVKPFRFQSAASALLPSVMAEGAGYYAGLPPGVLGGTLFGAGVLGSTAQKTTSILRHRAGIAKNLSIARQASATGEARDAVMEALASHPDVIRARQERANLPATP